MGGPDFDRKYDMGLKEKKAWGCDQDQSDTGYGLVMGCSEHGIKTLLVQ